MMSSLRVEPTITVVMPVFNRVALLRKSVESVLRAAHAAGGVEIICVDQGSTDGSAEWLRQQQGVRVISHPNGTIAAQRNAGAVESHGELLCFLDSDILVPEGYFSAVRRVFDSEQISAAGSECDPPADGVWHELAWHRLNVRPSSGPRHYINSANFVVRQDAFKAVAGFDVTLVTGEDTDICRRLVEQGSALVESRDLAVVHLGNPKSLGGFFRKEIWRGLGMSGGQPWRLADRPTAMTAAHLLLTVVALATLFLPVSLSILWRLIIALSCLIAVPAASWLFRLLQTGQWVNPIVGIGLFEVYYAARGVAFIRALTGAGRSGA